MRLCGVASLSRKVVIDRKTLLYLSELPEKSQRLIKEKCHALAEDPFPGQGGDKELLSRIQILSIAYWSIVHCVLSNLRGGGACQDPRDRDYRQSTQALQAFRGVMHAHRRRLFSSIRVRLLSTFLIFYFQWRPESDGSKQFYDIIKSLK